MVVTFLGTATSTGVPVPTCHCSVCSSTNLQDKRLRSSLLVRDGSSKNTLLIDTGPDVRVQLLREGIRELNAICYTHHHFDHVAGIDDIKLYTKYKTIPIYGNEQTIHSISIQYPYHFNESSCSTGSAIAHLDRFILNPYQAFFVGNLEVFPLPLIHGNLEPFGYRIGSFAYLLDCKVIPEASLKYLENLEVLVLTGLRPYQDHKNHLTFEEAVRYAQRLQPKLTLLSHISDEISHVEGNAYLQEITDQKVEMAYDGLSLEFNKKGGFQQKNSPWLIQKIRY